MQETWVQFPGWEDPLEEKMATHSSVLAWEIPWTEELGRLQSMVSQSQTRLSMYIYNKVMIQIVFPDRRRMRSELKETETSKNLGEEYQIESKTQRTH